MLHYDRGVGLVLSWDEHQEYFKGSKGGGSLRLKTLPPSGVCRLEIWESRPPETPRACRGLHGDCFTFTFRILISYPLHLHLVNCLFLPGLSIKILYTFLFSPIVTTFHAFGIFPGVTVLVIFGDRCASWSSSLWYFSDLILHHLEFIAVQIETKIFCIIF